MALCLPLTSDSVAGRFLNAAPLARIAKYSYAMYLWHLPLQKVIGHVFNAFCLHCNGGAQLAAKLLYLLVLYPVIYFFAVLSWKLVERPALLIRDGMFFSKGRSGKLYL